MSVAASGSCTPCANRMARSSGMLRPMAPSTVPPPSLMAPSSRSTAVRSRKLSRRRPVTRSGGTRQAARRAPARRPWCTTAGSTPGRAPAAARYSMPPPARPSASFPLAPRRRSTDRWVTLSSATPCTPNRSVGRSMPGNSPATAPSTRRRSSFRERSLSGRRRATSMPSTPPPVSNCGTAMWAQRSATTIATMAPRSGHHSRAWVRVKACSWCRRRQSSWSTARATGRRRRPHRRPTTPLQCFYPPRLTATPPCPSRSIRSTAAGSQTIPWRRRCTSSGIGRLAGMCRIR